MSHSDRESELIASFVSLTGSLAEGFDVVDLLSQLASDCVRLLGVESAGLLLADPGGTLHLLAASSQATHDLELLQLQRDEGPCLDCFHSGAPVLVPDLRDEAARWPQFSVAALEAGFISVHAVPMRLRENVLGALNLFGGTAGLLDSDDLALAQALAHVASVALIQNRVASDQQLLVGELNTALSSRVVLEQAKGILSQVGSLDMELAFAVMRKYARDHNEKLSEVAAAIVARALPAAAILKYAEGKSR